MSKKSENWYLGSSYIETIGFRRPAHKKGLFISILMTRRERCNIKGITEENFAETICSGPTLNYMCNATKFRLNNTIRETKHKNTQTKIGKQNDQRMKRLKEKIAETVNLPQFILNYVYHKKTTFKVYSKYLFDYDVQLINCGTYFQL